ncbi:MAG: DUF3048 domain-containing protein [Acidimicrobiia bacterium]|nr:DUF3048 domain-containing protein [Acidimicrobiia bacterium]
MQYTRPSLRRAVAVVAALLALALVAAACGDDGDDAAATTTSSSTTTTVPATTTTTEPGPVMQLTGLPVPDELAPLRTAMIAKIDNNNSGARPQRGLTTADIVIEEAVESGESRFFAVFHTQLTDSVGPVRSARTSDIDLISLFGKPVFSSSGGNAGTMRAIRDSGMSEVAGHDSGYGGHFFRMRDDDGIHRRGPHNLFINLSVLYQEAGPKGTPPAPFATFRAAGDPLTDGAAPTVGADVSFGNNPVQWRWDADKGVFLRTQSGTPHIDTEGRQIGVVNVLLLSTQYARSPFDSTSPEAVSVGSGEAWILTSGHVIHGTWTRPDRHSTYTFTNDVGAPISLTPGQTFVELLRPQDPPTIWPAS